MNDSFDIKRQPGGTVIISYDDGAVEDYTLAYPVHRKYRAPAEICMPSGYVGREGRVTKAILLELQAAGWEIVSHTKNHVSLAESALTRTARRGDARLYIANPAHYKPSTQLSIVHGENCESVTVTGSGADEHGKYIEIGNSIERDYVNQNASMRFRLLRRIFKQMRASPAVRLSDGQAGVEIEASRRELESMGLAVRHFTYPYNRFCLATRRMVMRCYESARAGSTTGVASNLMDRYALRSTNFERNKLNDNQWMSLLETAQEQESLCIFHAHTRSQEFCVERLDQMLSFCRSRGIKVSTRSEFFSS